MHMHSISAEVEIGKVDAKFDKETGKKLATTFLKSGEKGICVVKVVHLLFSAKNQFAWKNTNSCQVLDALLSVTKESNLYSIQNCWLWINHCHQTSQKAS